MTASARTPIEDGTELIREFNRIYTKQLNLLNSTWLEGYSLAEARAIFELTQTDDLTPSAVAELLGLDRGYVSRLLASLKKRGLVAQRSSRSDGRSRVLSLTKKGNQEFGRLQALANAQATQMIQSVGPDQRDRFLGAFRILRDLLSHGTGKKSASGILVRKMRHGDLGTILQQHGELYADELGWGIQFEAYVAETLSEFGRRYDPERERVWIAERDGQFLGCVALVQAKPKVAQLRWLLVRPEARGLGVGRRLVEEVLKFSRECKYGNLILWTEQTRDAARTLYRKLGFRLVETKPSQRWGTPVIEEKWALEL